MATHIIDLPTGKAVAAIVEKGEEIYLKQRFASVVKLLEDLPPEIMFPVKLNFSTHSDANASLSSTSTTAGASTSQATEVQAPKATVPSLPKDQAEQVAFIGWDDFKVKSMLVIIKEKKELLNVKNKKPVWQQIAEELSTKLKVNITGSQCYDKYRKLKQSLRKYEDERKQTGNGTPKPFKFTDLYEIVGDDPTLQPQFTCDSEGNTSMAASTDSELPEPPPKRRQKTRSRSSIVVSEIGDLFAESQKDLQETLITMHNENKELLSKLIDKL